MNPVISDEGIYYCIYYYEPKELIMKITTKGEYVNQLWGKSIPLFIILLSVRVDYLLLGSWV